MNSRAHPKECEIPASSPGLRHSFFFPFFGLGLGLGVCGGEFAAGGPDARQMASLGRTGWE